MKTQFYILILAGSVMASTQAFCQAADVIEKQAYYVSINDFSNQKIIDFTEGILSLEYNDKYGIWKTAQLKIADWKLEQVASVSLDKSFGVNHYKLDLFRLYSGWQKGKVYNCEIKDESGRRHTLSIRPVDPAIKPSPEVDIVVNPVQLHCDGTTPSLVEFGARIEGGKAPYTLQWVVINEHKTKFLYQPESEVILESGKTSLIIVDKSPDYFVLLEVKDACGNKERRQVYLQCDEKKKKINSLFVEPIVLPLKASN